jgi:RNA polymerase sigma factor (sigma-70 family)
MDLASKMPPPVVAPPSDPPSGVRLRRTAARDGETLAHTCAEGESQEEGRAVRSAEGPTERAFTEFVKAQVRRTPHYARRLRISVPQAEDIRQWCLENLFPLMHDIEPSKWEAWLWSAMHLRRLRYFRGVRRARKHESDILWLLQSWQGGASPEVDVYQRECARDLVALIEKLAPERREVVCLYLVDDLLMNEVAEKLGIPFNTAKDRWRCASQDMAAAWERDRVKERTNVWIAALLVAAAAVVAFWRRLFPSRSAGGTRRRHQLLACAACAMLVSVHAAADEAPLAVEPVPAGGRAAEVSSGVVSPAERILPQPGPSSSLRAVSAVALIGDKTASTEPGRLPPSASTPVASSSSIAAPASPPSAGKARVSPAVAAQAHKHLKSVRELRRAGHIEAARRLLKLYRLTYPEDPFPSQFADLSAALVTP